MYILKNAITSIRRSKGRNILIGIIVIVIAVSCTITLAILNSANGIVKAYEEKNALSATIEMNRHTLMEYLRDGDKSQEEMINAFSDIKNITEEEIINYADSKYVSSYYYKYNLNVNAKNIKEATDSLVKETTTTKTETNTTTRTKRFNNSSNGNRPGMPPGDFGGESQTTTTSRKKTTTTKTEKIFNEKSENGAFTLIGYNSYEDMSDFISGKYVITDGEVSNDFESNNCVISEELASLNSLKVGDKITVVDPRNEKNTYELIITGIYKENTDESSSMNSMYSSSVNSIITNNNFIKNILKKNSDLNATITPVFYLTDKSIVEDFAKEVSTKGLSEYYQVTNNLEEIESATEVVNNVKTFAVTFLIITLVIGGVVLIVINMINIRERKYEIGVLRTIGMKKSKVSLQFTSELLIVCIISLLIGASIGTFASVPVSNKLLQNEIENANSKYEDISKNFGMRPMEEKTSDEDKEDETTQTTEAKENTDEKNNNEKYNFGIANINEVESIDAAVNIKVLLELLGIGIGLTLFSSLASMIAISRFSPLTILKERS